MTSIEASMWTDKWITLERFDNKAIEFFDIIKRSIFEAAFSFWFYMYVFSFVLIFFLTLSTAIHNFGLLQQQMAKYAEWKIDTQKKIRCILILFSSFFCEQFEFLTERNEEWKQENMGHIRTHKKAQNENDKMESNKTDLMENKRCSLSSILCYFLLLRQSFLSIENGIAFHTVSSVWNSKKRRRRKRTMFSCIVYNSQRL